MNVFSQPLASLQILYNSDVETFILPHNDPKHSPHMLGACQKGLIVQDLVTIPHGTMTWNPAKVPNLLIPIRFKSYEPCQLICACVSSDQGSQMQGQREGADPCPSAAAYH